MRARWAPRWKVGFGPQLNRGVWVLICPCEREQVNEKMVRSVGVGVRGVGVGVGMVMLRVRIRVI